MDIVLIGITVVGGIAFMMFLSVLFSLYRKCGPNEAMIVTGYVPGGIQIVRGGGAVIWPLLNQLHRLSLEAVPVPVGGKEAIETKDGSKILVDGFALGKVKDDAGGIALAAERFLGKSPEEMSNIIKEVTGGCLRSTVAAMTEEELKSNRDTAALKVREAASQNLDKLGLTLEHFTIKGITKIEGSPNASGTENKAEANSSAAVGEAQFAR